MALWKALQVAANAPLMNADGANDVIALFGDFVIPTGFASGDIVEMCGLPARYVPLDTIIDVPSSLGATMTANVGILTGVYQAALDLAAGARVCGAQFNSAKAMGTAGLFRMDVAGGASIAPLEDAGSGLIYDRGVGIVFSTATTPVVGAKVRMTLFARPQIEAV